MRLDTCTMIVVGLWIMAVTSGTAHAGDHKVVDEAKLFSSDAVRYTSPILDQIHDQLHHDLMIETFASIPEDLRPLQAREEKATFYNNWVISEARKHGVNGVFILVTKDPPHVQVGVGNKTRENDFTLADRDELVGQLADAFHKGSFNDGLLDAARFVRKAMARNEKVKLPPDTQPVHVSAATAPATSPTSRAAAGESNK